MVIILFAVVECKGKSLYIYVGNPGSVGDAATFMGTKLRGKIEANEWLQEQGRIKPGNVYVRPILTGDAAFPLRPYLMKNTHGIPDKISLIVLTITVISGPGELWRMHLAC